MRYYLTSTRARDFEIEVEQIAAGFYRVLVGGREIEADFVDVDRLGQYAVRLGEASLAASIEEIGDGELRVTIAGSGHRFQIEDERERAASALRGSRAGEPEIIKAAMPGVVIGVHVTAGEILEAGAPILVLEAMKMQNEVSSEHGGMVAEILVESGDTVTAGQPLVRLAPAEEEDAG